LTLSVMTSGIFTAKLAGKDLVPVSSFCLSASSLKTLFKSSNRNPTPDAIVWQGSLGFSGQGVGLSVKGLEFRVKCLGLRV